MYKCVQRLRWNRHTTLSLSQGLRLIAQHRYLLGIFGVATFYEVIGTILDYQMKFLLDNEFKSAGEVVPQPHPQQPMHWSLTASTPLLGVSGIVKCACGCSLSIGPSCSAALVLCSLVASDEGGHTAPCLPASLACTTATDERLGPMCK